MSAGSGNIEDRIVSIKFDNAEFENKIAQTMASLDQFTSKLTGVSTLGNKFSNIQQAADSVNLSNIGAGVDSIAGKLSALGAIGFTVIQNLTNRLLGFAGQFVQQDILGPLITGGKQRALDLQQANFQFAGLGLNVTQVMADANNAVLGTAFSLSDAAKAAGQLGAAGIQAGPQMESTLRAIAGVSALTGSQFSDMAYIFTQTAAQGQLTTSALDEFQTKGLNVSAALASQLGVTDAQVRDMVHNRQIDFQTFAGALDKAFGAHATEANQTYTGSLANMHTALARIGALLKTPELVQSRDLFNAVTPKIDQLKTALTPLISTLVGIRGDSFSNLQHFFENVNVQPLIFGFQNIADGLKNIANFLKGIFEIGKFAFKEIFPGQFIVVFTLVTDKFKELTEHLFLTWTNVEKVANIFRGLFSILDIGWAIIKGVATVIGDLLHALFPAGAGLLNAASGAGSFLEKMDTLLVKGGRIQEFFSKLGQILAIPIRLIAELAGKITGFLAGGLGAGGKAITDVLDRIHQRLGTNSNDVNTATGIWSRFTAILGGIGKVLSAVFGAISSFFHSLFHKIAEDMHPADFNSTLDAINVGLLGGITLLLKKFFAGGVKFGFGGGVFTSIKTSLSQVTRSFQLLQTELKAKALREIAEAIGIVAVSVLLLSLIDSDKLTKALLAMSIGFGQLAATLAVLDKAVSTAGGAFKIGILAGALIALASAMVIFALAVKIMSTMNTADLAKGLTGIAVGISIMVQSMNAIDAEAPKMLAGAAAIGIMAFAMVILAHAVKEFAKLSLTELAKGLGSVAVSMAIFVVSLNALDADTKGFIASGIAIGIIAVALRILADAVKEFGSLSLKELAKGLGAIAITMAILIISINALDANTAGFIAAGISLGLIAVALSIIAGVISILGRMSLEQLGKGIGTLAIVVGGLVLALNLADGALPGAAALLIAAGALLILSHVLEILGKLNAEQIVIALAAIAGVLLVIGIAGLALSEATPFILALGIALSVVGLAFALFGVGAFLAVTAMELFATVGVKALAEFIKSIPLLASAAADIVINFANDVLIGLPTLIKTIKNVLDALLELVIKEVPKIAEAIGTIITSTLLLIQNDFPLYVQVGISMVLALLQGINDNITQITDAAVGIVVNFLKALTDKTPDFVDAASNLIVTFLNEVANHTGDIIAAGVNVIVAIITGIGEGDIQIVGAVADLIVKFLGEIANHLGDIIGAGASLIINIITGIGNALGRIEDAVTNLIVKMTTELGKHTVELINAGVDLVLKILFGIAAASIRFVDAAGAMILSFLDAVDKAVNKYEPQIIDKGIRIGVDIIGGIFKGLTNGFGVAAIASWIGSLGDKVLGWAAGITDKVWNIGAGIVHGIWNGIVGLGDWFKQHVIDWVLNHIPGWMQAILKIASPSKVMADQVGKWIPLGIMMGIESQSQLMKDTMSNLANTMVAAFNPDPKDLTSSFTTFASGLTDMKEFNPTITPVLDLSKIQEGANGISGILGAGTITPDISTQNATIISASTTSKAGTSASDATTGSGDVIFSQTINAPTALSTDDIYRNTKSQITLAKEELKIS